MRVHEVVLRALSGEITWIQAAEILGRSPRSLRRLRWRFEHYGYEGLYDGRRIKPSPKRAPVAEVERILRLYRERYPGFNGRHFYQIARREHAVTLSYTFVKRLLQHAGLLAKSRPRGRHRRRREPRPCFGELVHLDGSRHAWLALTPEQRLDTLLYEKRYSLFWEFGTTWIDARNYGKLPNLPKDRPGDAIFPYLMIPTTECNQRVSSPPAGCTQRPPAL